MTKEQREKASIDLTLTYFQTYYADWRLAKVLTLKSLIQNRHSFYKDIVQEVKGWDDGKGEPTISQEIYNGLHHDAIAHCIQYIEDLFALMSATKDTNFFVRKIISYNAGKITGHLKAYKSNRKNIQRDFFIPDLQIRNRDNKKKIEDSLDYLVQLVGDQVSFYKKYCFFYNQYKHGLAIPMRLTECFTDEQVEYDIRGEMPPFVKVYDNLNIKSASNKETFDPKHGIMIHGFTENVQNVFSELEKENNFLRLVSTPDFPEFNIDMLLDQARKTRACISVLIANYSRHILPETNSITFQLPVNYVKNESYICSFPIQSGS